MSRVVIVGAGLAGARTAAELREQGYRDEIVLVGDEPHEPYDRPPLSKEVLSGALSATSLAESLGLSMQRLHVDHRAGVRVVGLELSPGVLGGHRPVVDLGPGGRLSADAVVLATGGRPAVPVAMMGMRGVLTLRSIDDALDLREQIGHDRSLVIVGAGWVGAEVASAAAWRGSDVTVLEAGPAPLAGAAPRVVGERTREWYAEAGVCLVTGASVDSLEEAAHAQTKVGVRFHAGPRIGGQVGAQSGLPVGVQSHIHGTSGEWLADTVLLAMGWRPATGFLRGSAVELDGRTGAVIVDAAGRTSMPGVFAVGDAAMRWSPRYGAHLPGGHWQDALDAPFHVAASVLDHLGESEEGPGFYDAVPYAWSDQFGRTLQLVGRVNVPGSRIIWRESQMADVWTACVVSDSMRGTRLHGVIACGRPKDATAARRTLASVPDEPLVDDMLLVDPLVSIRDGVRG